MAGYVSLVFEFNLKFSSIFAHALRERVSGW